MEGNGLILKKSKVCWIISGMGTLFSMFHGVSDNEERIVGSQNWQDICRYKAYTIQLLNERKFSLAAGFMVLASMAG